MPSSDPECIFCKIIRREAPASIVYEDGSTLAFMDIHPVTAGHTLVVPKMHGAYLEDPPKGASARSWRPRGRSRPRCAGAA